MSSDDDNQFKVNIKMVPNWTTLAVQYKRDGGPNVTAFMLWCMFNCIRVPPWEIEAIRLAWRESE